MSSQPQEEQPSSATQQQQQQQEALACEVHGTMLQHFKGMNADSRIVMIDFRENIIEHFYGFPTLPNVQCMRFDANRIESFLGMSYQPKLQVLTLAGNPISEHPDYRIMALLACGPSLNEIDGRVIMDAEREFAESLGGATGMLSQMISLGWTSLDFGNGSIAVADSEWAMETCRAEFLRVSQSVDEATSFGTIAPTAAELVPLAAERPKPQISQQPVRLEKLTPAKRTELSPPRKTGNAIPPGESARSMKMKDAAAEYASTHYSPASAISATSASDAAADGGALTTSDVNSLLHSAPHPNFNAAAREGVTQQIMESRATQMLAAAQIPKKSNASALELARQYARAYQQASSSAPSASPAGPSPPSQMVSKSPSTARVNGADLTLSRADIINMTSIEVAPFDVSAQWQPPKSGTIQIVRSLLRLEFCFFPPSSSSEEGDTSSGGSKQHQLLPRLVVLDDGGRTVASFALPVSSPDHPQSLWIHDGDPPAIALCSEQDGGVIDVVLMPSSGSSNATARAQTLHKMLIHAMAEHVPGSGSVAAAASVGSAQQNGGGGAAARNSQQQPPLSPRRSGTESPKPRSPRGFSEL